MNGNPTRAEVSCVVVGRYGSMRKTMNISLSDELHAFVTERVNAGCYGSASEYIRTLLRRDRSELYEWNVVARPSVRVRRANEYLADLGDGPDKGLPG